MFSQDTFRKEKELIWDMLFLPLVSLPTSFLAFLVRDSSVEATISVGSWQIIFVDFLTTAYHMIINKTHANFKTSLSAGSARAAWTQNNFVSQTECYALSDVYKNTDLTTSRHDRSQRKYSELIINSFLGLTYVHHSRIRKKGQIRTNIQIFQN